MGWMEHASNQPIQPRHTQYTEYIEFPRQPVPHERPGAFDHAEEFSWHA